MIDGKLILIIFANDGTPMRSMLLSPPGKGGVICYRLCTPMFHAVLPLDEVVVYHETTNGPFVRNEAVLAEWAPADPLELRAFLENAAIECGSPPELFKVTV
jgi:cupin fold WbuC family metalloprotein